ncbi:MAG TPA: histidine kinase [Gaiellaceae bacterium]|nr:histidine kinase [Gaiellaceae bacterium]
MIWNWIRRHPVFVDVAIAGVVLVITTVAASGHTHSGLSIAVDAVASVALLWRRRQPLAVVVVVTALSVALVAAGGWLLPFPLAVALFTFAAARPPFSRSVGAISIGATSLASLATSGIGDGGFHLFFTAVAWLLGDSIGSRRAYIREIEEKADRLEREREIEAHRAVAEEQARIGRELHDVIAHALSVIVVQAGAAEEVFDLDPQRAREPLRAIDAAARTALSDLRRVLGLLAGGAEYEPQPGLDRLDSLVEQVRATGLDVLLELEGERRPLPAAVDLSAYRIVQEALTNTLKHAHASHAKVRVGFGDEIALEIADDGSGSGNGTGGSGLIGMRQRAALLGGTVEAGNGAGGGFVVRARIPV